MTKERKNNLGRYLMGLGIGTMLGVGQTIGLPRKFWWWPVIVGVLGVVIMIVGFELIASASSEDPGSDTLPFQAGHP